MKKPILKTFTPISAVAAVFGLAASAAYAQTTPVFEYYFPDSWNGTGTTVTDQTTAGNNGFTSGSGLSLNNSVPLFGNGAQSLSTWNGTAGGGILTNGKDSLNNANVAAAGGFTYNVSFMWDGTNKSSFGATQKIIDYAGTESLQLITTNGSATLEMVFENDAKQVLAPVSTTVLPNTWYSVTMTFNNTTMVGDQVVGTADLNVNGVDVGSGTATKGSYGDSLDRPIGIGQLGANFGWLVGFYGDIYDPNVSLNGPVPEPSTLALGALGGVGLLLRRRRKS